MILVWLQRSLSLFEGKSFVVPQGFAEEDSYGDFAMDCYRFIKRTVPKFLPELSGRKHPLEMTRTWAKTNSSGIFVLCELQKLRLRYYVTVHIPIVERINEMFIHRIETIDGETQLDADWSPPNPYVLEDVVSAVQEKFGDDLALRTVVMFKSVDFGRKKCLLALDMENDLERMLISVNLEIQFHNEFLIRIISITRIE